MALAGRRAACELPAVLRLQLGRAPGSAPSQDRLPVSAGWCCHPQQQAIFANGERLAGVEDVADQGPPLPGSGTGERLGRCRGQGRQQRSPIGICGDQTSAMIGLEGAQAAPPKPGSLVFPDRTGGKRWLRVHRGDLCINGEESGIAADQGIRSILRPAAISAALLDRRRHRSGLGRCRRAQQLQREQTDYRQAPGHRLMIVTELGADNKFRKSGIQRTLP